MSLIDELRHAADLYSEVRALLLEAADAIEAAPAPPIAKAGDRVTLPSGTVAVVLDVRLRRPVYVVDKGGYFRGPFAAQEAQIRVVEWTS